MRPTSFDRICISISIRSVFPVFTLALAPAAFGLDVPREATIPLTLVHDIPAVAVSIGNARSTLMLDTGGQIGITLSQPLIDQAGSVEVLPQTSRHGDAAGHVFEVHDIDADKVAIGDMDFGRVRGEVNYRWGLQADGGGKAPDDLEALRARGVIGLGMLAPHPLLIDYARGKLTIYPVGEVPAPTGGRWLALPMEYDKVGVNVTLSTAGQSLRFVLDTGSNATLVNPSALSPVRFPKLCKKRQGNDCGEVTLPAVRDQGGHVLGSVVARAVDLKGVPFDGLLGGDFLKHHAVLLDFAQSRMWIAQ